MRRTASLMVVLAVSSMLACNQQQAPKSSTPPATASPQVAAPAPWKIELTTDPAKPMTDENTKFRAALTDPSGKPVGGADVTASLVMPLMDMGNNEFRLADIGKGVYEGTGKVDMSGPWNVVITVKSAGQTAQQTVQVVVGAKE